MEYGLFLLGFAFGVILYKLCTTNIIGQLKSENERLNNEMRHYNSRDEHGRFTGGKK